MSRDRLALLAAYVILIAVVAATGWRNERQLSDNRDTACVAAAAAVSAGLAAINEETSDEVTQLITEAVAVVVDECQNVPQLQVDP
jgi:prophage DNA circulation protein